MPYKKQSNWNILKLTKQNLFLALITGRTEVICSQITNEFSVRIYFNFAALKG